MDLPLIRPNPPRLSQLQSQLQALEVSGIFTGNGPIVGRFERELVEKMFDGKGACVAVSNATAGLMLAIRQAAGDEIGARRYALMPSFASAAAAHAAIWAGLTPLFCDIDPRTWMADRMQEDALLTSYRDEIAVVVPHAAFGSSLDLEHYEHLARHHGVPVIVNAPSSLGTTDRRYRNFGTGSGLSFVYSMHASEPFATTEGAVIYSADTAMIDRLRAMASSGLEDGQYVTMPGMNAALSEVNALMALAKLAEIDRVIDHRAALAARYRNRLPDYEFQDGSDFRQAIKYMAVLLPQPLIEHRARAVTELAERYVGAGTHFSPHLAEQPYFRTLSQFDALPVCDDVGRRILTLPISDMMTTADVDRVCTHLRAICAATQFPVERRMRERPVRAGSFDRRRI